MRRRIKQVLLQSLVFSPCLLLISFAARAQTYKQVEIEVAGPWAYVIDPSDANRVLVITPNTNHAMDVLTGGNANAYSNQMDPGVYSLNFKPEKCATHSKVTPPNLLELTTDAVPNSISTALSAKNKRFALSLPKPCYYETYLDSRAKVSSSTIDIGTQEQSYTTWMSLHYTVLSTTSFADLTGNLDSGSTFSPTTIKFSSSYWPPTAEAVSVVAYFANVGEDFPCDSHSAHHFDAALSLLSQPPLHRLFPELDASGKQTHRYGLACSQTMSQEGRNATAASIKKQIQDIRDKLKSPDLRPASSALSSLVTTLSELWQPRPPQELLDDLSDSAQILDQFKERGARFPSENIPLFLKLTELLANPGRADCHAMQVNIDNAVP